MSVDSHVLLGDKVLEDAVEDRLLMRCSNCSCRSQRKTYEHNNLQPERPSKATVVLIHLTVVAWHGTG